MGPFKWNSSSAGALCFGPKVIFAYVDVQKWRAFVNEVRVGVRNVQGLQG